MSVSILPSGRYRAQVYHRGRNYTVGEILGCQSTFAGKREAKAAVAKAREKLGKGFNPSELTVEGWRDRWLSDPLFARGESTQLHRTERTKKFAEEYGHLRLQHVGDDVVSEWLKGGKRNGTVRALRTMFSDASSAKAGRLIDRNPFAGLGVVSSKGRKEATPPTEEEMEIILAAARKYPSFAAYYEFACFTGCRPGEVDALLWENVDFDAKEVHVVQQWNARTKKITLPKHDHKHTVVLTPRAEQAIRLMPQEMESPYVFKPLQAEHYKPTNRTKLWGKLREKTGFDFDLYLATRHFAGSYMLNVLGLEPHVIATQLGHRDQGKLVLELYGHPSAQRARQQIHNAFASVGTVKPLRAVGA